MRDDVVSLASYLKDLAVDFVPVILGILGGLAGKGMRGVAQMGAIPSLATGKVVVLLRLGFRALELDNARDRAVRVCRVILDRLVRAASTLYAFELNNARDRAGGIFRVVRGRKPVRSRLGILSRQPVRVGDQHGRPDLTQLKFTEDLTFRGNGESRQRKYILNSELQDSSRKLSDKVLVGRQVDAWIGGELISYHDSILGCLEIEATHVGRLLRSPGTEEDEVSMTIPLDSFIDHDPPFRGIEVLVDKVDRKLVG